MDLLVHAAISAYLITSEQGAQRFGEDEDKSDHIDALPFTTSDKNVPVDSWNVYLTIIEVTAQEATLLPKISIENEDLIVDVGLDLFEKVKCLPTALWKTTTTVRKGAFLVLQLA